MLRSIGMGDEVEHASTVTSSAFPFLLGRKKRVRARGDCIPPLPDATRMMDEAGSDPKAALVAIPRKLFYRVKVEGFYPGDCPVPEPNSCLLSVSPSTQKFLGQRPHLPSKLGQDVDKNCCSLS